jgi:hypothetical protein
MGFQLTQNMTWCLLMICAEAGPESLTLRSVSAISCCVALTEKAILNAKNIIARY